MTSPRVEKATLRVWTQPQTARFLAATAKDRFHLAYRLALSLGMRRGELLALKVDRRRLDEVAAARQHTLTDDRKLADAKIADSRRTIELPSRSAHALADRREAELAAGRRAIPWVFGDAAGKARNSRLLGHAFDTAIAAVNAARVFADVEPLPRIRFHDLRHTYATLRLAAGDHPKVVSDMLGHASITIIFDTYSHALPSMRRDAADKFDAIL